MHYCNCFLPGRLSSVFSCRLILRKSTVKSWSKSKENACNQKWGKWILIIRFYYIFTYSSFALFVLLACFYAVFRSQNNFYLFSSDCFLAARFFMMCSLTIRQSQSGHLLGTYIMKEKNLRYSSFLIASTRFEILHNSLAELMSTRMCNSVHVLIDLYI